MFNQTDIKWAKSVKRNDGTDWAYYEEGSENTFFLNHTKDQLNSDAAIKAGEIILLFQRPDKIDPTGRTYLTHLVAPLYDTPAKFNDLLPHEFKWEREVVVVARAEPRDSIYAINKELNFIGHQFGKAYSINNLNKNESSEWVPGYIWQRFDHLLKKDAEAYLKDPIIPDAILDDTFSAMEGKEREVYRRHLSRERNAAVVNLAKSRARAKGNGTIVCECCSFDFFNAYGKQGDRFIEAHHIIPIATGGERRTTLEDLAMVCANCHRMLHIKQSGLWTYHSVDSLRELVNNQRNR